MRGVARDERNVSSSFATNLSDGDSLKPSYRPRGLGNFPGNFVPREPCRKHPAEFRARLMRSVRVEPARRDKMQFKR